MPSSRTPTAPDTTTRILDIASRLVQSRGFNGFSYADIAEAMGIDTHGMTKVQAAEAALAAGIRLLRDVGIPERFIDIKQDTYSKNRLGQGPTKFLPERPGDHR